MLFCLNHNCDANMRYIETTTGRSKPVISNGISSKFDRFTTWHFLPNHQISTGYRYLKSFVARSKGFIYETWILGLSKPSNSRSSHWSDKTTVVLSYCEILSSAKNCKLDDVVISLISSKNLWVADQYWKMIYLKTNSSKRKSGYFQVYLS